MFLIAVQQMDYFYYEIVYRFSRLYPNETAIKKLKIEIAHIRKIYYYRLFLLLIKIRRNPMNENTKILISSIF